MRGRAAERQQDEVPASKGRFDILGLALSMIGFTSVVYGISEASSRGWGDGTVLTFLIGGGVVLVAFVITALLVSDPVMDVRLFLNYTLSLVNVTRQVFAAVGVSVLTTYLTQRVITHGNEVAAAFQQHPPTGIAATCAPLVRSGAATVKTCVVQHITTQGLNDTFIVVMIACGICAVLALFVGRDPAIQAARRAASAGEVVEEKRPTLVAD